MSRRDIYYWKCDRPAAFHGTQSRGEADANLAWQLGKELQRHFDTKNVALSPGAGQGNHLTWNAEVETPQRKSGRSPRALATCSRVCSKGSSSVIGAMVPLRMQRSTRAP